MKKRLLMLLCVLSILLPSSAFAQSMDQSQSDVVYGAALGAEQRKQMDQAFGISENSLSLIHI